MSDRNATVRAKAAELGFDIMGVARADEPLTEDFDRYEAFVDQGLYGGMSYLAKNREVRRSLAGPGILPGARSVICVARRYALPPTETQGGIVDRIARYARGRDYHNHVRRRLRKLAAFVTSLEPDARSRPMIDTAPVLERAWAARSGIGFIGKNGMLICPGLGSFTILGEVVTTVQLTPGTPMPPRCGRCTACLDACPSSAFRSPYVLDARRCVSYWTIEHRGPWEAEWEKVVAPRLFGCDVCQEVCPYNHGRRTWIERGGPFDPLDPWAVTRFQDLIGASRESFLRMVEGSPLARLSFDDWRRNLIGALGEEIDGVMGRELAKMAVEPAVPAWLSRMARERSVGEAGTSRHIQGALTERTR